MQKINQKEFTIEKVIKRKGNKFYAKWKGYDNSFNDFHLIKMGKFSPKPYKAFGRDINVKVNLSNYATKTDFKNMLILYVLH